MTDTSSQYIPNLDTIAARDFATDITTRVTQLETAVAYLQTQVAALTPVA